MLPKGCTSWLQNLFVETLILIKMLIFKESLFVHRWEQHLHLRLWWLMPSGTSATFCADGSRCNYLSTSDTSLLTECNPLEMVDAGTVGAQCFASAVEVMPSEL